MPKILVLLAEPQDEKITEQGLQLFRDFRVSYQIRCGSAQEAPDYLKDLLLQFQQQGGQVIICLGPEHDILASFVTSFCSLPVLQVVVAASAVSLRQQPGTLPVATLGFGSKGFTQAALFSMQLLSLQESCLQQNLQRYRHSLAAQMIALDQKHRVVFHVQE